MKLKPLKPTLKSLKSAFSDQGKIHKVDYFEGGGFNNQGPEIQKSS